MFLDYFVKYVKFAGGLLVVCTCKQQPLLFFHFGIRCVTLVQNIILCESMCKCNKEFKLHENYGKFQSDMNN